MDTPGVVDPRAAVDPWAVIEALPDAIAVVDAAGQVRFRNAAWRELGAGRAAPQPGAIGDDLLGWCAAELPPDPPDSFDWAELLRRAAGGAPPARPLAVRCRATAARYALAVSTCPIDGGALQVLRLVADGPPAHAWLLDQALQQTDDAVIITDERHFPDGPAIIYVNHSFERHTGYPAAEALGRSPHYLLSPGSHSPLAMQQAAAGQHVRSQVDVRRKDGSVFSAELTMAPLHGRSGAVTNWVTTLRDTRRHEQRAQRLRGQGLSTLAGGFAHTFNNLLTVVLGSASLALLDHPEPSPTNEALTAIHDAARRGGALVAQLLTYAGKGRLQAEVIDVNRLVSEAAGSGVLPPQVRRPLALTPDLPPVLADAEQLRRVVLHLLRNAAESIGDSPGAVSLSTSLRQLSEVEGALSLAGDLALGPYVAIEVRDSGAGLDAAALEHVFEPFFSTKFSGRGLGLAEALGVISGHGGGIMVESAAGVGAVFTVLLPPADV